MDKRTKRILIISDSHGRDDSISTAINKELPLDAILHLGDSEGSERYISGLVTCPVYMVAGNCDYFTNLPIVRIVQFGTHRIMMTHGHYHYVSVGTTDLLEEARANDCDIVAFGHTHRPVLEGSVDDVLVLNPGSISFPRQEGRQKSYMLLEIDEEEQVHVTLNYIDSKVRRFGRRKNG